MNETPWVGSPAEPWDVRLVEYIRRALWIVIVVLVTLIAVRLLDMGLDMLHDCSTNPQPTEGTP